MSSVHLICAWELHVPEWGWRTLTLTLLFTWDSKVGIWLWRSMRLAPTGVFAAAGTDSDESGSGQLGAKALTSTPGEAVPHSLQSSSPKGNAPLAGQRAARSPKAPVSPKSGCKRKAGEL